ncbi:MAG: hypothetical protein Q4G67_07005 [Actinomycetia bacterium]|nr:hypothetical protein [Actinomycetes bacterium]
MRTTVDLPPATHRRARELAEERGDSLSSTLADLVARGLAQTDSEVELVIHSKSGFPMIRVGRPISAAEVDEFLDEDD